jgi:hypothetical protein
MKKEEKIDRINKIMEGLKKAYEKMLEFKKEKKSDLVVIKDNKIVRIKM